MKVNIIFFFINFSVHRLEDLIDDSFLSQLKQLIDNGNKDEVVILIQKSLLPEILNSKIISFTAWKFDVTGTIYSRANGTEVMDGWNLLIKEKIPISIYTKAYYVTSLYFWLEDNNQEDIQVLQLVILELLRLCYWVNRCKQIITDKKSFETKFNEVVASLQFKNETGLKEKVNHNLVILGEL